MSYVSYVLDLAIEGQAQFGGGGPITYLADELVTSGLDLGEDWDPDKPTRSSGEIYGKSLHFSTANQSFARNFFSIFTNKLTRPGNSLPFEMDRMMSYVGLRSSKSQIYGKFNNKDLKAMSTALSNDLLPIVFENHGISHSGEKVPGIEKVVGIHFIVMHSLSHSGRGKKADIISEIGHYGRIDSPIEVPRTTFLKSMKAYWIPLKR
jgi:hypothetical protein